MIYDRVAKRNDLSEPEIETMLKDLGQDLIKEKPINLNKLGIDEIAVGSPKSWKIRKASTDESCLVPIN